MLSRLSGSTTASDVGAHNGTAHGNCKQSHAYSCSTLHTPLMLGTRDMLDAPKPVGGRERFAQQRNVGNDALDVQRAPGLKLPPARQRPGQPLPRIGQLLLAALQRACRLCPPLCGRLVSVRTTVQGRMYGLDTGTRMCWLRKCGMAPAAVLHIPAQLGCKESISTWRLIVGHTPAGMPWWLRPPHPLQRAPLEAPARAAAGPAVAWYCPQITIRVDRHGLA